METKHIQLEKPRITETYTTIDRENGCVVLPCWFVREGNTHRNFLVKGKVLEGFSFLDKNIKVLVNVDTSLSPSVSDIVVSINNNGRPGYLNDVEIPIAKDGSFEFKITLSLKNGIDVRQVRRITIKYNARVVYKHFLSTIETFYESDNEKYLDIFMRSALKSTWIGLDPGTSGSCVCIGRGGSIVNPNIRHLGDEIIPSTIVIPRTCPIKNSFTDYVPAEDYLYGQTARQQWKAEIRNGGKGFVSIKKLLGYNSQEKIPVIMNEGTAFFSGAELAHLLIKGINREVHQSINEFTDFERQKYLPCGSDSCNRLVVAIPNNYTLPKILDMIQSVQWLNEYQEIRYIYEPEAIVFNYLMKEFSTISNKDGEVVMVFDMGGATINASIYKLAVRSIDEGSDKVCVKTLGKIGYAVGGDNIDFALIEALMDMYVGARGISISDEQKNNFERTYKDTLIVRIFELKMSLIQAKQENYEGLFCTTATFILFINETFKPLVQLGYLPIDEQLLGLIFKEKRWSYLRKLIVDSLLSSNSMQFYVFDRVQEAVKDVLSFVEDVNIDTLVFSGRSVLFPGIKEKVNEVFKSEKRSTDIEWIGMNDQEIKSAVAKGACWYGMYSTSIQLDNELITSSYGYGMTIKGEYTFCPVIPSNSKFDKDGVCKCNQRISSGFNSDANFVKFYQMMGNVGVQKFDEEKIYKRSYLGDAQIHTTTKSISMKIDRNDNLVYYVEYEDGNSYKSDLQHADNRDITDENDRAYCFATLPTEQRTFVKEVQKSKIEHATSRPVSGEIPEEDFSSNAQLIDEYVNSGNINFVAMDEQKKTKSRKRTRI